MNLKPIKKGVYFAAAVDWDRKLFDALIPLPSGTTYNAYLIEGSEAVALIDTVDTSKAPALLDALKGVPRIDYVVSQHSEQDHSGALPAVLERYPGAKVLTSLKGKGLLTLHLHIPEDRITVVADSEVLSLGGKTLEFISTPWVHWPETFSTYLREDRILFTCDLFGSHLAVSGVYEKDRARVVEATKRYYAEVMMPFRAFIKKHIERFSAYEVNLIAPSHGPVHYDPGFVVNAHQEWVSDSVTNTAVLAYVSMHGSTELMADRLTDSLTAHGVTVERFNLAEADAGALAMSLVDAATLVIGAPAFLNGPHPHSAAAAYLINSLRPKLRFASFITSAGWGAKVADALSTMLSGLRLDIIPPVAARGRPVEADLKAIDALAEAIAARHKASGID